MHTRSNHPIGDLHCFSLGDVRIVVGIQQLRGAFVHRRGVPVHLLGTEVH